MSNKNKINNYKLIFVSPVTRIIQQKGILSEGGVARYNAWDKRVREIKRGHDDKIEIIELTGEERLFQLIKILGGSRQIKVFLLYPHAGIRLDRNGFVYELLSLFIILMIKYCALRNQVVLDVSDLKYEQSLDLEIDSLDSKALKLLERILFSSKHVFFVFASESMREYAIRKYAIPMDKTKTCINGGDIIEVHKDDRYSVCNQVLNTYDNKILYVYSGTLNRGRNIEEMINCFPNDGIHELVLMGSDGDWIDEIVDARDNIKYLGEFQEEEAHRIVACCDVGLIPYDDSKLYYNIAYPTKLSFYITAGITYLSTPTREIQRLPPDSGFICKMSDWKKTITETNVDDILKKKDKIQRIKNNYSWEATLSCSWIDNNEMVR